MTVRVLAFARLRELLGFGARELDVAPGTDVETLWARLASETGELASLRASTRFARNGALVRGDAALADGDEIALMPPVGGG